MGTLKSNGNTPVDEKTYFNLDVNNEIQIVKELAKTHKLTFTEAASIIQIMEAQRTNKLLIQLNNRLDENLSGIGDIIESLPSEFESRD